MAPPIEVNIDTALLRAACARRFASSSAKTPMNAFKLMLSSVSSMSKTTALSSAMGDSLSYAMAIFSNYAQKQRCSAPDLPFSAPSPPEPTSN